MNDTNIAGNAKTAVDFLGNTLIFDCMGCAITNGEIQVPGGIIYDGKSVVLAADPEVPIPGFLIVNVRKHAKSFADLTMDERHEIIDMIATAEKALKELGVTDEVTIVQEERSQHLHVWIFPHYGWMNEKFGKGVQHLRDIFNYACENSNPATIDEVMATIEKVRNYINNR